MTVVGVVSRESGWWPTINGREWGHIPLPSQVVAERIAAELRVMYEPAKGFTAERAAQGFKSERHWMAWSAYYGHFKSCPACNGPGSSYWNEADASWQPVGPAPCPVGAELFAASSSEHFTQEVSA